MPTRDQVNAGKWGLLDSIQWPSVKINNILMVIYNQFELHLCWPLHKLSPISYLVRLGCPHRTYTLSMLDNWKNRRYEKSNNHQAFYQVEHITTRHKTLKQMFKLGDLISEYQCNHHAVLRCQSEWFLKFSFKLFLGSTLKNSVISFHILARTLENAFFFLFLI